MADSSSFIQPDESILRMAWVLQEIRDVLKDQRNNKVVTIIAHSTNSYYWAMYDPTNEDMWVDEFYGDIREMPFFDSGVTSEKRTILDLLKEREVISTFTINSKFEDPENMGWKDYEVIHSFELQINLNKFLKYYEKYKIAAQPALNQFLIRSGQQVNPEIVESKPETKSINIEQIKLHKLEPKHYSTRTGKLTLSPLVEISFANKGKTRRKNGDKYLNCLMLEKLFKTVYSLKSGIYFRTFLGVNDFLIDKKLEKKIRNTVTEINKKVSDVGGPKNLIKIQHNKIFVNSSYL